MIGIPHRGSRPRTESAFLRRVHALASGLMTAVVLARSPEAEAQGCAGLPNHGLFLLGTASTSIDERTLELSPGFVVHDIEVRGIAARIWRRAGVGSALKVGGGAAYHFGLVGIDKAAACAVFRATRIRREGETATDVNMGVGLALPRVLSGALGRSTSPIISAVLANEQVTYADVVGAGEDYSAYNHSDSYGIVSLGLALLLTRNWSVLAVIDAPVAAATRHASIRVGSAVAIGGKRRQ